MPHSVPLPPLTLLAERARLQLTFDGAAKTKLHQLRGVEERRNSEQSLDLYVVASERQTLAVLRRVISQVVGSVAV